MVDEDVVRNMRKKYNAVHPLVFARSVERARSAGDLYDILESVPMQYPFVWHEEKWKWALTDDPTQSREFVRTQKKQD